MILLTSDLQKSQKYLSKIQHFYEEKNNIATSYTKVDLYWEQFQFEVDAYLLDDLKENEIDIKDILFAQDVLDDNALTLVANVLDKYVSVLHETIEFNDIATSLESLSKLLKRLSIDMIEENKREMLLCNY